MIYQNCFPAKTHKEVIWFDVSMQKPFRMHVLYSCDLQFSEQKQLNVYQFC